MVSVWSWVPEERLLVGSKRESSRSETLVSSSRAETSHVFQVVSFFGTLDAFMSSAHLAV